MALSIIILDKEVEYEEWVEIQKMPKETQEFLQKHGIKQVNPIIYTLHDDDSKSNATLSLRAIDPSDLPYFMPELESRTENVLRIMTKTVKRQFETEGKSYEIQEFRDRLLYENQRSQIVHLQQRPAIARAILSPALDLFDKPGKTALTPGKLLQPNQVIVINYRGLDRNKRRVVAIYLQLMLDRFKMNSSKEPGCLLVIDEAEELFGQTVHKSERDYVSRIIGKMEDVVNRGRKHKFGLLLVTHSPAALAASVADLTNVKCALGSSGADKWISSYFGKQSVKEISDLPTGIVRIATKISNAKQQNLNLRFRVPFVGDAKNLSKEVKEP